MTARAHEYQDFPLVGRKLGQCSAKVLQIDMAFLIPRDRETTCVHAVTATRIDRDAWRDLARKEGDERRELAQRLALAAPIAASGPPPTPETSTAPDQRRPWWR